MDPKRDEWFCFGDIRDEDIPKLQETLEHNEFLTLGWKDLNPDVKFDDIFRQGGGAWLVIGKDEILFDVRRDGRTGN
jgi:hypothetical protein